MSNPEDRTKGRSPDASALKDLEGAVKVAVAQIRELRAKLLDARAEGAEMQELLQKFTGGEEEPSRLLSRLRGLEAENKELLHRLKKGRAGVDRLLARIRFLEEQGS